MTPVARRSVLSLYHLLYLFVYSMMSDEGVAHPATCSWVETGQGRPDS
jgi:hypothetical protein